MLNMVKVGKISSKCFWTIKYLELENVLFWQFFKKVYFKMSKYENGMQGLLCAKQ